MQVGGALAELPPHPVTPAPSRQPEEDAEHAQISRPFAASDQGKSYSTDYQSRCDRPENREEADLCQQWRSAQAAEGMVELSDRQFWATVFEAGLLFLTLGATAWAAWAAVRAARSAEIVIRRENRPRLGISQIVLPVLPGENLKGHLIAVNEGGSTATIVDSFCAIVHSRGPLRQEHPHRARGEKNQLTFREIESGKIRHWEFEDEVCLTGEDIDNLTTRASGDGLYVVGMVTYASVEEPMRIRPWLIRCFSIHGASKDSLPRPLRDRLEFDIYYRTLFCRRYDPKRQRFRPEPKTDWEYRT